MKINKIIIGCVALGIIALTIILSNNIFKSGNDTYGSAINTKQGITAEFDEIFNDISAYEGKNIILEGKVGQVCKSSGCWIILTNGEKQLYIEFYTFTANFSVGTKVRVQGTLKLQNMVPYLVADGLEIL